MKQNTETRTTTMLNVSQLGETLKSVSDVIKSSITSNDTAFRTRIAAYDKDADTWIKIAENPSLSFEEKKEAMKHVAEIRKKQAEADHERRVRNREDATLATITFFFATGTVAVLANPKAAEHIAKKIFAFAPLLLKTA